MLKEFRAFIMRGNVFDLAVAFIMGAAFGKIVSSFTQDILLPPIGLILGHVDFSNFFITLSGERYATLAEAKKAGAVTVNYGLFISTLIDFLIVAFAVFLMVRAVNKLNPPQAPPAAVKSCPYCATDIPLHAVRCPHCTSSLGESAPERLS